MREIEVKKEDGIISIETIYKVYSLLVDWAKKEYGEITTDIRKRIFIQ